MNIEAIRLHAQNKGDRKLLKLVEGAIDGITQLGAWLVENAEGETITEENLLMWCQKALDSAPTDGLKVCASGVDREGVIDECIDIMNQFKYEKDEDSCGYSFFTARINEDSFFIAKNKLQSLKTTKPSSAPKPDVFDYDKEYELHLESGVHEAEFQGYCFANEEGTFCVGIECVKPSPAMSASSEQGEQWQPIETAPKGDLCDILLLIPDSTGICLPFMVVGHWRDECEGWSTRSRVYRHSHELPTHWMPLPTPPQQQNATTGEGRG